MAARSAGGALSAEEGQELGTFVSVAFVLAVSSLMVMLAALYSRRPAHLEHVKAEQHTESIWIQAIAEVLANFRLIAGYAGSREKEIGIFTGKYKTYWGKLGGRVVFEIHSTNIVERVVVLTTCAVYLLPAVLTINNGESITQFNLPFFRTQTQYTTERIAVARSPRSCRCARDTISIHRGVRRLSHLPRDERASELYPRPYTIVRRAAIGFAVAQH